MRLATPLIVTLALASPASAAPLCWVASGSSDTLVQIDLGDADPTTNQVDVGPLGAGGVTALAVDPWGGGLYALADGALATVDTLTGSLSLIGGPGEVVVDDVPVVLDELQGLAFDSSDGTLWACASDAAGDVLVQLGRH